MEQTTTDDKYGLPCNCFGCVSFQNKNCWLHWICSLEFAELFHKEGGSLAMKPNAIGVYDISTGANSRLVPSQKSERSSLAVNLGISNNILPGKGRAIMHQNSASQWLMDTNLFLNLFYKLQLATLILSTSSCRSPFRLVRKHLFLLIACGCLQSANSHANYRDPGCHLAEEDICKLVILQLDPSVRDSEAFTCSKSSSCIYTKTQGGC